MPGQFGSNVNVADLPEKVYRGSYGYNAQLKISFACVRKGRRAVFPDCKTLA